MIFSFSFFLSKRVFDSQKGQNKCLLRSETWHGDHIGQEEASVEVTQSLLGVLVQVNVPQVPLLGHGKVLETWNYASWAYWPWESRWKCCLTPPRWPGPSWCTTGDSSKPRWGPRDLKLSTELILAERKPMQSCPTSPWWPWPSWCPTGASSRPWGGSRDLKLGR